MTHGQDRHPYDNSYVCGAPPVPERPLVTKLPSNSNFEPPYLLNGFTNEFRTLYKPTYNFVMSPHTKVSFGV